MPELPEVQTTVNGINKYVKGLQIKDVWTSYGGIYHVGKDNIKDVEFFAKFKKNVIGKKIKGAKRRAKNVLIELSDGSIVLVHLKMTGHLLYGDYRFDKTDVKDPWKGVAPKALLDPFNRFIRLIFKFENGKYLALSDMRRFAKVTHIEKDAVSSSKHLENIGPEPLEESFDAKKFKSELLKRPRGPIKQIMMDQSLVAGIGNIYSDEILWRACVHPERRVSEIKEKEWTLMHKAMKETLKSGIDFGGDSMSDYRNINGEKGGFQEKHNAYRLKGKPCKKRGCKGTIIRKVIATRSAHFCETHQK